MRNRWHFPAFPATTDPFRAIGAPPLASSAVVRRRFTFNPICLSPPFRYSCQRTANKSAAC